MKKYIVLYHAPKSFRGAKSATQEEMKKGMEEWMAWAQKCGDRLVDMGTPLGYGQRINKSGHALPSTKEVVGYSALQAESMKEAEEMLKNHPHLKWAEGCEIEVHESLPLPGSD